MITDMKQAGKELAAKGIKPTFQRLAVMDYLLKNMNHPTAEMLFGNIPRVIPSMSRTTVYNTLKMLIKAGLVNPVYITSNEVRYEAAKGSHHHMLCQKCSSITDVNISCPVFKKGNVDGHLVCEVHGYFMGICSSCIKKERKKR